MVGRLVGRRDQGICGMGVIRCKRREETARRGDLRLRNANKEEEEEEEGDGRWEKKEGMTEKERNIWSGKLLHIYVYINVVHTDKKRFLKQLKERNRFFSPAIHSYIHPYITTHTRTHTQHSMRKERGKENHKEKNVNRTIMKEPAFVKKSTARKFQQDSSSLSASSRSPINLNRRPQPTHPGHLQPVLKTHRNNTNHLIEVGVREIVSTFGAGDQ